MRVHAEDVEGVHAEDIVGDNAHNLYPVADALGSVLDTTSANRSTYFSERSTSR